MGARQACALATVVAIEGSVSADLGAKAIFAPDGRLLAGWIGGGCAQARAGEVAQHVYQSVTGSCSLWICAMKFWGAACLAGDA